MARRDGTTFSEKDLEGSGTVLVFYPFAFSPVCTDQLVLYEELRDELAERDAKLYGARKRTPATSVSKARSYSPA